jgi:hypothetical protein
VIDQTALQLGEQLLCRYQLFAGRVAGALFVL